MNALSMYQNVTAADNAKTQAAIDTTANQVDPYRPEVSEKLGTPTTKATLTATLYHFLFVGLFLFGGMVALGTLTGELDLVKG